MFKKLNVIFMASTLLVGAFGISVSNASNDHKISNISSSSSKEKTYTNQDIVAFTLFGTGRILKDNPQIAKELGFKKAPEIGEDSLNKVTDVLLENNSNFYNDITLKLQSHKPLQVEEGLNNLYKELREIGEKNGIKNDNNTSNDSGDGKGWYEAQSNVYHGVNGVVYSVAIAVANVGGYTEVLGATLVWYVAAYVTIAIAKDTKNSVMLYPTSKTSMERISTTIAKYI